MKGHIIGIIIGMVMFFSLLGIATAQDIGTAEMWFVPNEDKTEWKVYGSHTAMACCYQFLISPEEAWKVIEFDQYSPLDFFEQQDMNYRVVDSPNNSLHGYGQAIGSYPLGQMQDTFNGLMGTIYASEPMEMALQVPDDYAHPPAFWLSGLIPAIIIPTDWWVEDYVPPPSLIKAFWKDMIPRASAQVETLTYEQETIIDIKEACFNNGTLCSSSANCNISIFNPRGIAIATDEPMTQHTSRAYFNYTINETQTDRVGFYRYDIVCADTGLVNFGSFNLQVTAGGNDPSVPQTISYAILLALLVGLFIFTVYGFAKTPARNHMRDDGMIDINYMKYVKFVLFFVAYVLLIAIMFSGWQMSLTVSYLDFLSNIFRVAFIGLVTFLTPMFIISVIMAFVLLITDKKTHKAMMRGVPMR